MEVLDLVNSNHESYHLFWAFNIFLKFSRRYNFKLAIHEREELLLEPGRQQN